MTVTITVTLGDEEADRVAAALCGTTAHAPVGRDDALRHAAAEMVAWLRTTTRLWEARTVESRPTPPAVAAHVTVTEGE